MQTTTPFFNHPLIHTMLTAIETQLHHDVGRAHQSHTLALYQMLAYQMGWEGKSAGPKAQGKRIRPLLVLLSAAAAGGDWQIALPAASAVELLHNFSLIHDDIEDKSNLRRGRPTLWKQVGIPQAINAGDAMFSIANLAILDLKKQCPPDVTLQALEVFQNTCLHLTTGQYLDMDYETRDRITLDDYWPMIGGKTAALITASTKMGAIIAGAEPPVIESFAEYGKNLGLAFQVLDDYLGIWGDESVTGKSVSSDLLEGKKSLPVIYGLSKNGAFAKRWARGPVTEDEVSVFANQLASEGGQLFTQTEADQLTEKALRALKSANPGEKPGDALLQLTYLLLYRSA